MQDSDPEAPAEREIGREMVDQSTGLGSVLAHLYRGEVAREISWREGHQAFLEAYSESYFEVPRGSNFEDSPSGSASLTRHSRSDSAGERAR